MYGKFSSCYYRWSQCYDIEHKEISKLSSLVDFREKNVLEIGCGSGRFTYRILPFVNSICGIDIDNEAISIAESQRNGITNEKLQFIVADGQSYNLKRKFDIVIFTWSLYQIKSMEKAIKMAIKHLSADGTLIILQPFGGQFENTFSTLHGDPDLSVYSDALKIQIHEVNKYFCSISTINFTGFFTFSNIDDALNRSSFFFESDYGKPMTSSERQIIIDRLKNLYDGKELNLSDDVKFIICTRRRLKNVH